jgi:peptide/nickel transport system substrate-binding protein
MIRLAAVFLIILTIAAARAEAPTLRETPNLAAVVERGELPPVEKRLPDMPLLTNAAESGTPGGELRLLMASGKDTRLMVVYGYARLMRYTPSFVLEPDIAAAVDVADGRRFTIHLRPGHKWSDGKPLTAEDFRYWFEDVASNSKLAPSGLPEALLVEGEKPRVEFPDATTIRYSWSKPNPRFLPALAGPSPLFIFCPAHYLKQFHAKYADEHALAQRVAEAGHRNWAALHNKLDSQYRNDNPDLPTLDPWVLKTRPPSERFIFERNPFFHRVDPAGHQLPYIDRVTMSIADAKIIPAKTGAGESDLQARYLRFDNYTFLREAETRNDYSVRLWRTAPASQLALYPNLNASDPAWRKLLRDVRFRRALSLAIDRHRINQVIYYGLAIEGQNTLLPDSPLYEPAFRTAWAKFDPDAANKLLDDIGLTARDDDGNRLMPDGRPLQIVVENAGESTEESDVLELIHDNWQDVGVELFSKPSQLKVFRNRVFAGETLMSIAKGFDNGLPTADMPPLELAPTSQQQLQWPKWGQFAETNGHSGLAPDMPMGRKLVDLFHAWFDTTTDEARRKIWQDMLEIHADEVLTIGLVAGVPQPVVVSNRLHNVPEKGIYNWDPGAHFGVYHIETFWLTSQLPPDQAASAPPDAKEQR